MPRYGGHGASESPSIAEAFGSADVGVRGILSLLRLASVFMQISVISAATGELVWEYASGSLWRARGWELRMWLCEAIHCGLYFSVVLFVRQMLLCDTAYIGEYAEGNVLTVYMLRREIDDPSDYDALQVETALRHSDRVALWAIASRGVHMRFLLPEMPGSDHMVNPLVLAIQSRIYDDPEHDYELPTTIQTLLWARCSPHDFGVPEVSPLCDAIRSGDDMVVLLLLQNNASPSMREEGSNDPIFVAIDMSSAENVHRLLQYSANPRSREVIPTREGHAGRRRQRRRTALEAAASRPRCQRVLLDFIAGI